MGEGLERSKCGKQADTMRSSVRTFSWCYLCVDSCRGCGGRRPFWPRPLLVVAMSKARYNVTDRDRPHRAHDIDLAHENRHQKS